MSPALVARTVAIDDPGDLLSLAPVPEATVWLHEGDGFVAWDRAWRSPVPPGPDRFERAQAAVDAFLGALEHDDQVGVPGSGAVAVAGFSFDGAAPGSLVTVPRVVVGRRDGAAWVTVTAERGDPDLAAPAALVRPQPPPRPHGRVRYAGSTLPEVSWLAAVAEAEERIRSTVLEKVVLARDRRVWAREPFDARVLARRLADRFPTCFTFAVEGLVGATPELLIRRRGAALSSLVLAGSAGRSPDPHSDDALAAALRASAKDRREHALAVTSVRQVLEAHADDVTVDPEPWLLTLANVRHLATAVTGRLRPPGLTALALAGALHPTAAVGGTPTAEALAVIAGLEGMGRARYAAPVGWVDARGDGEFGIALRCAEVSGGRARLFAGAGVVEGSLPEAELEETRLKLRAMQSALEGQPGAGGPDA